MNPTVTVDYFPNLTYCDTPSDDSDTFYAHFDVWVNGVTTTALVLLGIFASVYSVRELAAMRTARSFRHYLRTLAVWDTTLLATSLCMYSMRATLRGLSQTENAGAAIMSDVS